MKNAVWMTAFAFLVAFHISPLMAEESAEHQNHSAAQTEHDHGQPAVAVPATESHHEKMADKMIKMSVRMEKMQQEVKQAEEQMVVMKALLAKAQQASPGTERDKLLAEHSAGLRHLLVGFRASMEKMMANMEKKMGSKEGMSHGGEAKKEHGDSSDMMEDMTEHHKTMKKRLALLTDLMGQMETHLAVMASPTQTP